MVDAVVAGAALAAAAPMVAAAAVLVRTTSPGPAFFRQQRIGQHGRPFTLLKLRTMNHNAAGASVTAGTDPRITPIGRWLRRYKVDELPSLWNVVRGDMSLVGPRPEVPKHVDLGDARWQEVLSSRPGLTDPVTLRLRNEEELLATAGDAERFYREHLAPYKLAGYVAYERNRTWETDLGVLAKTALAVIAPRIAPPPTLEDVCGGSK